MLPDGVGRADDRKAYQQQDLCEAEPVQAAFGEALDKGIGADGAIHLLLAVMASGHQCKRLTSVL